jgi:hypothetical protein
LQSSLENSSSNIGEDDETYPKRKTAFIDVLLRAEAANTGDNAITQKDIRDEVNTFMFAVY